MRLALFAIFAGLAFAQTVPPNFGNGSGGGGASPAAPTGSVQTYATSTTFGSLATLNVAAYGCKGDGLTDDSTCITNALAALNTANGGTLVFPNTGNCYLVNSQITLPSFDATNPPHHYPMRLQGIGTFFNWNNNSVNLGSCIDMRYSGTAGGQLYGSGLGALELDHLAFVHNGTAPKTSWTINGANLTSIVVSSNVATVTTAAQSLQLGNAVLVTGSSTPALNGIYQIASIISGTQFTFTTVGVGDATYNNAGLGVSYTTPFFYMTNTQLLAHNLFVRGDISLSGNTNVEDVFIFGGNEASNDNTVNSGFGGYESDINNVWFSRIQRGFVFNSIAQQVTIDDVFFNLDTGSSDTNSGSAFDLTLNGSGSGLGSFTNNYIGGVYAYGFHVMSNGNSFSLNSYGDHCCVKAVYHLGSGAANNTAVVPGYFAGAVTVFDGTGNGKNAIYSNTGVLLPSAPAASPYTIGTAATYWQFSDAVSSGFPAWYGPGITPSGSNYTLSSDGSTTTFLNAPSGGAITMRVNNSEVLNLSGVAGSANAAVCWKTTTTLGHCTSVVGAGGTCTCN